ncbi:hypothetical protein [Photobacterium nomapromontoriensis]|uniref:hypothetical protein n=1 Tax=Photobacterium nomapromontoriensis TaxID=2910237 RepID=UPI003D0AEA1F
MNIKKKYFFAFSLLLTLQGCTFTPTNDDISKIPVTWSTGFTLPKLLISPVSLHSINDIPNLITANWYDYFSVKNRNNEKFDIYSCQDYFSHKNITPVNAFDINPFLNIIMMCEAAKYLLDAKPSQQSYLPISILDKYLPLYLPKELALQTSTNAHKRTIENINLTFWQDILPIINFEYISDSKAIYHFDNGYQEVEIVGRGDINHDNIEDLIIIVRDSLNDGSYFNLRLFILSVNKNNEWHIIEYV